MSAISNGILLHGAMRPFASTFLIFSEYAKNAIRMSALMKLPMIYVFTHDSIGLGEDGPTHQAWWVGPSSPRPIESWVKT